MLGDLLGGINFVKVAVMTPYFYTVGKFNSLQMSTVVGTGVNFLIGFADYECVLDHSQLPVPYSNVSELQIDKEGKVQWDAGSEKAMIELPPGAQRYVHYQ